MKLVSMSGITGEYELANSIAKQYIRDLLNRNDTAEIFQIDNISILLSFNFPGVLILDLNLCLKTQEKMSRVMKIPNAAQSHIHTVIYNEKILPLMKPSRNSGLKELDWKKLRSQIAYQYGSIYSHEPIAYAKIQWFKYIKNWPGYTASVVNYVEGFRSMLDNGDINDYCWYVFQ